MNKYLKILLAIFIAALSLLVANLYLQPSHNEERLGKTAFDSPQVEVILNDSCGEICKKTIAEEVAKAIAAAPATETKTIVETVIVAATPKQTTYIGLGSSGTTSSTDWATLADTAVYIDPGNDYGSNAVFTWEASLKVAHGNGQAFARLYDETNGIAVSGSEFSTINNMEFSQVKSANLPFWRGNNLYKVQVKSLNGFEVTYSGGRIKVSY